jgi:hypothetical protein
MATTNKPIHGRHIKAELLLNGVAQDAQVQITDMTANTRQTQIETKVLGNVSPILDNDVEGWEGTITCASRSKSLEQFINAYITAKRNNVPIRIDLVEQITYRDGTGLNNVYPDVEVDFSRSAKRASATEIKFNWATGEHRITTSL